MLGTPQTYTTMNWNKLNNLDQLTDALAASYQKPVLLFKHSTRCSISSTALNRLERSWNGQAEQVLAPYFIDLIAYREVSNAIASGLGITHESPQALVVVDGQCVFDASHLGIQLDDLVDAAQSAIKA